MSGTWLAINDFGPQHVMLAERQVRLPVSTFYFPSEAVITNAQQQGKWIFAM